MLNTQLGRLQLQTEGLKDSRQRDTREQEGTERQEAICVYPKESISFYKVLLREETQNNSRRQYRPFSLCLSPFCLCSMITNESLINNK